MAIIVAHPDDEILWAGGTILEHPSWKCFILSLCRASDNNRAPKFYKVLDLLNAEGIMGDLDDGPEQNPLNPIQLGRTILDLLPHSYFDLIITHNPNGEYTRHLRHEEVSKAVITLWFLGEIKTTELWTFAYEDGHKTYLPKPVESAPIYRPLSKRSWLKKCAFITDTYGFEKTSWEAQTTPQTEAFWQFMNPEDAKKWLDKGGFLRNDE